MRNLYYKDIQEQFFFEGYFYIIFFSLDQHFWGYLLDVLDYLGLIHTMEQSCWSGAEFFNEINLKMKTRKALNESQPEWFIGQD